MSKGSEARPMRGPKGPGMPGPGGKPQTKDAKKTLLRLLRLMLSKYKGRCIIVVISIIISSLANVAGTLFLKRLIDDYILPQLGSATPNFMTLMRALMFMTAIF